MVKNDPGKLKSAGVVSGARVNRETLSPFDMTVYKGARWPGQPPDVNYRREEDEMAFSFHIKTERKTSDSAFVDFIMQRLLVSMRSSLARPPPRPSSPHTHAHLFPPSLADFTRAHSGAGGKLDRALVPVAQEKKRAILSSVAPPVFLAKAKRLNPPNSELRRAYERGDLPCVIVAGAKNKLKWRVELTSLDYMHYLPLFISGLREVEEPFRFISEEGSLDLVAAGGESKVLPVIASIVIPLKNAFVTRDEGVLVRSLRVLSAIASISPRVGAALVPYYRQLLPALNAFMGSGKNLGDGIDYGQRFGSIGDRITECLQTLERNGGPDALVNLKYVIATYESALIFD